MLIFTLTSIATNDRIGNETQVLTNQIWEGRVADQREKCNMYIDLLSRDNAQNMTTAVELARDVQEKADIFERLSTRINDLEKKEVATSTINV